MAPFLGPSELVFVLRLSPKSGVARYSSGAGIWPRKWARVSLELTRRLPSLPPFFLVLLLCGSEAPLVFGNGIGDRTKMNSGGHACAATAFVLFLDLFFRVAVSAHEALAIYKIWNSFQ